jgi:hypothetical protein
LPIIYLDGSPRTPNDLVEEAAVADQEILRRGWNRFRVTLPELHIVPQQDEQSNRAKKAAALVIPPDESYHRQVLVWLAKERSHQVIKFSPKLDDEHTSKSGLEENGWWAKQLAQYFHRARVSGLNTPVGRQALAKYVATACAMLESSIRIYGWLPRPGRPGGDVSQQVRVGSVNEMEEVWARSSR